MVTLRFCGVTIHLLFDHIVILTSRFGRLEIVDTNVL